MNDIHEYRNDAYIELSMLTIATLTERKTSSG